MILLVAFRQAAFFDLDASNAKSFVTMLIPRKDTPIPTSQRAGPPSAPNLRGGPNSRPHHEPPPLTPPYRIRTKRDRASKAHKGRPTPRETFLEGLTDSIENNARDAGGNEQAPSERISHDLSFTGNPRHSVVDNMLQSLNPSQPCLPSSPTARPPQSSGSQGSSTKSLRHRGHLPSSSSASDNTYTIDNSPSRFSAHFTRGRRSNSSSNFQSTLGTINSVRPSEDHGPTHRSDALNAQRAGIVDRSSAPNSRAGRKGGKGSGSSSVDPGHIVGTGNWQRTTPRRSSSFEDAHRDDSSSHPTGFSATAKVVPRVVRYPSPEVAPTRTISSGFNNRDPSPAIPGRALYPAQQAAFLKHKSSYESLKAFRMKMSEGAGTEASRLHSGRGESPSRPRASQSAGTLQNPTTRRQGHRACSRTASPSQATTPLWQRPEAQRERPGFFRRVFGSSRNVVPSSNDVRPLQSHYPRNNVRVDSRASFAPSPTLQLQGQADDNLPAAAQRIYPTVTKKSSSFFRRRKKSVSEPEPVSGFFQLPPYITPNNAAQPGPSLRQAMDPFLHSPSNNKAEKARVRHRGPQGSSSPTLNVSGRRPSLPQVSSSQRSLQDAHIADMAPDLGGDSTSTSHVRENFNTSLNVKSDDSQLHPSADSFLNDTSSTEDKAVDAESLNTSMRDRVMAPDRMASRSPVDASYDQMPDPRLRGHKPVRTDCIPTTAGTFIPLVQRHDNTLPPAPWDNHSHSGLQERLTAFNVNPSETKPSTPNSKTGSERLWLEPPEADEQSSSGDVPLPGEVLEASPAGDDRSATSIASKAEHQDDEKQDGLTQAAAEERPATRIAGNVDEFELTADDLELASRVYYGDESLIEKTKATAWLGDEGLARARVRRAFMNKFDWQNRDVLAALRDLCARVLLKGETQQIDRLLDALSSRWCTCNPDHGFKAADVVHTICYSLLLLNTDLHMAEIEAKMTRVQFLKNTMPTVRRVVLNAAPDAFENNRASTLPIILPCVDSTMTETLTEPILAQTRSSTEGKRSFETQRPVYRLLKRPSDQSPHGYSSNSSSAPLDQDVPTDDCGPLVRAPFRGKMSTWEVQVEMVLKNFYNSIRQQRLPLHITETKEPAVETLVNANTSFTIPSSMLRRTPSMLSKAASESLSFRGRALEQRFGTGRWISKSRQRPRLYPASTVGSSRTSLEEQQSSVWTPTGSSTLSKYSFGRTQTSMSVESFRSSFPEREYQQSVGFANALSQAIIREEAGTSDAVEETMRAAPLLEDESLELAGAPWAKEGILKHKHHLDAVDKKSRDRNWVESFAVIEKGCMRLFSFSMNAKSMRQKMRSQKLNGSVVGGGNWMDNAEALGHFSLRQTLASALPPPGYSKGRPHVWALSLPTGAVHLFQVGTPEIVNEFVTTANYWSARLSKEPLIGGVSNIEYGWSEFVINSALLQGDTAPGATTNIGPRPSLQSSIRSSLDQGSSRPKLPGDKMMINDWLPPQQSMVASVLMEVDQLKALTTYVKSVEAELERHNELRPAMLLAVRSPPIPRNCS